MLGWLEICREQGPLDFASGWSRAWRMRRLEWPPSRPRSSSRPPSAIRARRNAPRIHQLAMRSGPSVTIGAHRFLVAEPRAGIQRVLDVQLEGILLARDAGDAALGPGGVRLRAPAW